MSMNGSSDTHILNKIMRCNYIVWIRNNVRGSRLLNSVSQYFEINASTYKIWYLLEYDMQLVMR